MKAVELIVQGLPDTCGKATPPRSPGAEASKPDWPVHRQSPSSMQRESLVTIDLTEDDEGSAANEGPAALRGMNSTCRSNFHNTFNKQYSRKREPGSSASPASRASQKKRLSPQSLKFFSTSATETTLYSGLQHSQLHGQQRLVFESSKENQQPHVQHPTHTESPFQRPAEAVTQASRGQLPPGILILGPPTDEVEQTIAQCGQSNEKNSQLRSRGACAPIAGGALHTPLEEQQPQQPGMVVVAGKACEGPQAPREQADLNSGVLETSTAEHQPHRPELLQRCGTGAMSLPKVQAAGACFRPGTTPEGNGSSELQLNTVGDHSQEVRELALKLELAQREAAASLQALRTAVEEAHALRNKIIGLEGQVAAAQKLAAEAKHEKDMTVPQLQAMCSESAAAQGRAALLQQEVYLLRRALVDADKRGAQLEEVQQESRGLRQTLDRTRSELFNTTKSLEAAQLAASSWAQNVGTLQREIVLLRTALAASETRAAEGAAAKKREDTLLTKLDGLRAAAAAAKAQADAAKQTEAAARQEAAEARRALQAAASGDSQQPPSPSATADPALSPCASQLPPTAADIDRTLGTLAKIHLIQTYPVSIPGIAEVQRCYQLLCLATGTPLGGQLTQRAARQALAGLHADKLGQLMGAAAAWGPHGQEQCKKLLTDAFQKINNAKEVLDKAKCLP